MMKRIGLKPRSPSAERALELALPKCDPLLDLDRFIERRTKQMNVIGHDHVGANHPAVGLAPHVHQCLMDDDICQALFPMAGTDRHEDYGCLTAKNENALGGMATLLKCRRTIPRLD